MFIFKLPPIVNGFKAAPPPLSPRLCRAPTHPPVWPIPRGPPARVWGGQDWPPLRGSPPRRAPRARSRLRRRPGRWLWRRRCRRGRPSPNRTPCWTCGGNLPGSSSRKHAIHLYRFDSDTLFSMHHSLMVMSAERQLSMRPAHMPLRCASSIAALPNRLISRTILRQWGQIVKTR